MLTLTLRIILLTFYWNAPHLITAIKHYADIVDTLKGLERNPFINPVKNNISLRQYGINVRRENYKKMAIIYTIHDNRVYVHRILAGSLITGFD